MNKKALCLLLTLVLCLSAACALAATANAVVVAPETVKLTAPFSGTLLPFDVRQGDQVAAGQTLFAMDTVPVYAAQNGTIAAVFADVGDDASGVTVYYGALAVIEPEYPLYIAADTNQAYDKKENRYLHVGQTLYLKSGNNTGVGRVTGVSGDNYTVQILSGEFDPDDTVRCFRDSDRSSDKETGRGKVKRYADLAVNAQGRVAAVHVAEGDSVKTGDLLFEMIDAQSAVDAQLNIDAPADGAVTVLAVNSGALVYRGQLLCEIADLSALELSVEVDEIDLNGIRVGDALTYTLDAYGETSFVGMVTEIRPIGTAKQNATYFDVRISLEGGRTLLPGMNGTVTLK